MEPIVYTATKSTPRVHFDAQEKIFRMVGESYPENAFAFYEPLLRWIEQYLVEMQGDMILELQLTYLNTSSTRCMLTLFDRLDVAFQQGTVVEIRWYYHPDDDRSLEAAEEFKEDLSVPFNIIMSIDATEDTKQ